MSLSVVMLVAGCGSGGGDGDGGPEKIAGAGKGGSTASASPSKPTGGAQRPSIELPKSFRVDFVGWTNSDPKLQAILDDGREELKSKYAAIIEAEPDSEVVAFYNQGESLATAREWIKSFVDDDNSIIGGIKAYNPQVHINDTGNGVLFYCVDERKSSTKNRRTKKVTHTPDKPESVLQYRVRLDKSAKGVWKTVSLTTVPGGCR